MSDLRFSDLRGQNQRRAKRWNTGQPTPIEFDFVELAGEVGEACDAAKKLARGCRGMPGGKQEAAGIAAVADELADVVIAADLAADKLGIDLGEAIARKFNETSRKHGFPERLA